MGVLALMDVCLNGRIWRYGCASLLNDYYVDC